MAGQTLDSIMEQILAKTRLITRLTLLLMIMLEIFGLIYSLSIVINGLHILNWIACLIQDAPISEAGDVDNTKFVGEYVGFAHIFRLSLVHLYICLHVLYKLLWIVTIYKMQAQSMPSCLGSKFNRVEWRICVWIILAGSPVMTCP